MSRGGTERFLDHGRAAITGQDNDRGAFKTPTLREIARTAPYMHDGSLTRLTDVIEFSIAAPDPNPHLDREIRPLHLRDREKTALIAFLIVERHEFRALKTSHEDLARTHSSGTWT